MSDYYPNDFIDFIVLRDSVEQAAWEAQPAPAEGQADNRTFCGHKFRVLQGGFKPRKNKVQTIDRTMTGKADVQVGFILFSGEYTLKVKDRLDPDEDDPDDGSFSDLDRYYMLNNPSPAEGEPSNVIYMVDHYGKTHKGFLTGDQLPEPLTTILIGTYAYYTVQINFEEWDSIGLS